jgi:hypothetical protein
MRMRRRGRRSRRRPRGGRGRQQVCYEERQPRRVEGGGGRQVAALQLGQSRLAGALADQLWGGGWAGSGRGGVAVRVADRRAEKRKEPGSRAKRRTAPRALPFQPLTVLVLHDGAKEDALLPQRGQLRRLRLELRRPMVVWGGWVGGWIGMRWFRARYRKGWSCQAGCWMQGRRRENALPPDANSNSHGLDRPTHHFVDLGLADLQVLHLRRRTVRGGPGTQGESRDETLPLRPSRDSGCRRAGWASPYSSLPLNLDRPTIFTPPPLTVAFCRARNRCCARRFFSLKRSSLLRI